jgi:hypothetical protein
MMDIPFLLEDFMRIPADRQFDSPLTLELHPLLKYDCPTGHFKMVISVNEKAESVGRRPRKWEIHAVTWTPIGR